MRPPRTVALSNAEERTVLQPGARAQRLQEAFRPLRIARPIEFPSDPEGLAEQYQDPPRVAQSASRRNT